MPNWCFNYVEFSGEPERIKEVKDLFLDLSKKEQETKNGQVPDFHDNVEQNWLFDIEIQDCVTEDLVHIKKDAVYIHFATRWVPHLGALLSIARKYLVDFICEYEEGGNVVYGVAVYKDSVFTDHDFSDKIGLEVDYDEDADKYTFRGKSYESMNDIIDILQQEIGL